MKKVCALFFAVFLACCTFCVSASAADGPVWFSDSANVIDDSKEPDIIEAAQYAAQKTGFNIVIATTDDIGTPKTDAHVVEYADDMYDELCGINTDGILLLINCDTKYDYISTSGVCINYFSDYRIELILDDMWDDLVAERFDKAAMTFLSDVEYYYGKGKANHQQEILGHEVDLDPIGLFFGFMPAAFVGIIFGIVLYAGFSHQYKLERPVTRNYILENSLAFDRKEDIYLGTNVNRVYSPRNSSSSGGGHSHSHHSSTHHSHSGGRHGGGGRHR